MIASVRGAWWLIVFSAIAAAASAWLGSVTAAVVAATLAVVATVPLLTPSKRARLWPVASVLGIIAAVLATRAWLVPVLP